MVAPATATPLTSAFLPSSGCGGATRRRSLHFRHTSKNQCIGKSVPWKITARIELKPLPYELTALEPHMSQETLECHWGKHHRGYVEKLNNQIEETELYEMALEDIIMSTYNKGNILPPFHNAAQIWNHEFFWESMKPDGGGKPSGDLLELINRDFGSFEGFVNEFKSAATTQFGSGWAWLVYKANRLNVGNAVNPLPSEEDKKLVVVKSPNAVNPLVWDYSPLLTIDVWEHSYYLDFQNRRADYISTFLDKLVSWESVNLRLEKAKARAAERERVDEMKKREEEGKKPADIEIQAADDGIEEMLLDSDAEDVEVE